MLTWLSAVGTWLLILAVDEAGSFISRLPEAVGVSSGVAVHQLLAPTAADLPPRACSIDDESFTSSPVFVVAGFPYAPARSFCNVS